MSTSAIQMKLMPSSPDTDLEKIKQEAKTKIESFGQGKVAEIKEEPIAFGLKALIITFAVSEKVETDNIENSLSEIPDVSSVALIDYRRAVG
jgi:translation elongation factor aEF-1 beta